MPRPRLSLVVLATVAMTVTLVAQDDRPRFSATTDLVVLNARVTDRHGTYVAGLGETAFSVFEDGKRQPIHAFASEDAPVTVGLIIDSSISMWQLRDLLVESAVAFARASNQSDEMFALAFNERSWPALPPEAPFTQDATALGRALAGVIQPRGRTGLFDAIAAGLDYAGRGTHPRKVLTIVSDGGDNASTATANEILERLQTSSVVVYTVALIDEIDRQADPKLLRQLAQATGGESFAPRTSDEVRQALTDIARDVRHAYMIGFVPRNLDGEYHRLRVVATSAAHGRLTVKTRTGYLGGSKERP